MKGYVVYGGASTCRRLGQIAEVSLVEAHNVGIPAAVETTEEIAQQAKFMRHRADRFETAGDPAMRVKLESY